MRKAYLIKMDEEVHELALSMAKDVVGKENFSLLLQHLIIKENKRRSEKLENQTYYEGKQT